MIFEKTIEEIIDENYVYARALHYLGVDFFKEKESSVIEVCNTHTIDKEQLIKTFYDFDTTNRLSFKELSIYPLPILLKFLKHSHRVFIADHLPFVVKIIRSQTQVDSSWYFLLPELIEDIVIHIHEEEDTTFKYIEAMTMISEHPNLLSKWLVENEVFSLIEEFEHHAEEDEVVAMKKIIGQVDDTTMEGKLLVSEVNSFTREMAYHSQIENEILFPKALQLEKNILYKLEKIRQLN